MCHWTSLTQPIGLVDLELVSLVYSIDEFLGKWCRAAGEHPQRREIECVDNVTARELDYDGRCYVGECNLVFLDSSAKDSEIE